jgi:hypothetical protein
MMANLVELVHFQIMDSVLDVTNELKKEESSIQSLRKRSMRKKKKRIPYKLSPRKLKKLSLRC